MQVAQDQAPDTKVSAGLGQPFELALKSRRSAGYEWRPKFDAGKLSLVGRRVKLPKRASFGGAETEIFTFRALSSGHVGLAFDLVRPWEATPVEHRIFHVEVA
jgi:predicted secreted protein